MRRRSLFWRVYLHGLLLLVLVSVALLALGLAFGHDAPWRGAPARLAELVAADLRAPGGADALGRRLAELHGLLGVDLEVLAPDGRSLARAGGAIDALPGELRRELLGEDGDRLRHAPGRAFALGLGPAHARLGLLLLRWPMQHGLQRLLLLVGLVLGLLVLVSAPVARAITRPLERLTATARALAAGDLTARSGISGRDEVGELARTLDDMAARLAARLQAERELLAGVSHELRTPLARLRVALELAGEGPAEELRARLDGMGADLAELEALVENVLLAVRLERDAGRGPAALPLRPARLAPGAFLEECAERFRRHHPGRALELRLDGDAPEVEADPALLRRVLDNLLANAVAYAPPGPPIELWAGRAPEGLAWEVRDRGPGVGPDELPRLFEPFFRADASRARGQGGVGLGLTLCRLIVEAHGGRIQALARDGGGLVVRAWLPAQPGGGAGG
ncbi:MAG TPA: HAMP domain-containing sensor histidine kinase [Myxococcota bacterium]|nr:HAMP domain-containing sensor histidine kinase [Myxococcota bacterium]HRY93095.1 HAMP domain-containing sensor histidine kinase [Myxococcota bacterium]HSA22755.1 HAMP domain-containing sensor histidine kinase [Myxococcota bacterium]